MNQLEILDSQPPRTHDPLINELRSLLGHATAQERVDMFEMVTEGWCVKCGERIVENSRCKVLRDENPAHPGVWCGPVR
jgi:hypothetical protein